MRKFVLLFIGLSAVSCYSAGLESPTDLRVSNIKPDSLLLSWRDNSSSEKSVNVYRALLCDSNWIMEVLPKNTTAHTISGLAPYTGYKFQVEAVSANKAKMSETLMARTAARDSDHVIGPYRLYSQFADANENKVTGFIISDSERGYLALYDRNANFKTPNIAISTYNLSVSSEVSLIDDRAIITYVSPLDLSLNIREYRITNGAVSLLMATSTGVPDSRWIDSYKTTDRRIVICSYQQGAGIAGWFLHREPDGTWIDHGRKLFLQSEPNTQPAGVIRMAEDSAGRLWAFAMKDSWGNINAFRLNANFDAEEGVEVINHRWINGGYEDGLMTPHGELPLYFKAITDALNSRILLLYQNEERRYVDTFTTTWSLAKLSLTAWNADLSKQLVFMTPDYTERVAGNFALNLSRDRTQPVVHYSPLDPVCWVSPLIKVGLSGDSPVSQVSGYWAICMNRKFNDVIYIRSDGNVVVSME